MQADSKKIDTGEDKTVSPQGKAVFSPLENPCLDCQVGQMCCSRLSGLRVSKEEYQKHFKAYSEYLSVLKYKNMFIVSSKNDLPCPHWKESGCVVYDERPIDCRLYPYEITRIFKKTKVIKVEFAENEGCPKRDSLVAPADEAKKCITKLLENIYGKDKKIIVSYGRRRSSFLGIFDPIIARLSKILRAQD